MEIAIRLPDDVAARLQAEQPDISRHVVESLALAWYQSGELNEEQLRPLLGYHTRLKVHAFLAEHGVPLPAVPQPWFNSADAVKVPWVRRSSSTPISPAVGPYWGRSGGRLDGRNHRGCAPVPHRPDGPCPAAYLGRGRRVAQSSRLTRCARGTAF